MANRREEVNGEAVLQDAIVIRLGMCIMKQNVFPCRKKFENILKIVFNSPNCTPCFLFLTV